jgi:hypothetical protein
MIRTLSVEYGIKECCEALRVSRSGYYQWKKAKPSQRERRPEKLVFEIRYVCLCLCHMFWVGIVTDGIKVEADGIQGAAQQRTYMTPKSLVHPASPVAGKPVPKLLSSKICNGTFHALVSPVNWWERTPSI